MRKIYFTFLLLLCAVAALPDSHRLYLVSADTDWKLDERYEFTQIPDDEEGYGRWVLDVENRGLALTSNFCVVDHSEHDSLFYDYYQIIDEDWLKAGKVPTPYKWYYIPDARDSLDYAPIVPDSGMMITCPDYKVQKILIRHNLFMCICNSETPESPRPVEGLTLYAKRQEDGYKAFDEYRFTDLGEGKYELDLTNSETGLQGRFRIGDADGRNYDFGYSGGEACFFGDTLELSRYLDDLSPEMEVAPRKIELLVTKDHMGIAMKAILTPASIRGIPVIVDGHEAMDIGLPSGILWATCNIGAEKPSDRGLTFTFADPVPSTDGTPEGYKYYDRVKKEYTEIPDNFSGTEHDAAHVMWGGLWRTIDYDGGMELWLNSKFESTFIDGVYGWLCTGPNGNSIFFPDAIYNGGYSGCYAWTTSHTYVGYYAYGVRLSTNYPSFASLPVHSCQPIRPTHLKHQKIYLMGTFNDWRWNADWAMKRSDDDILTIENVLLPKGCAFAFAYHWRFLGGSGLVNLDGREPVELNKDYQLENGSGSDLHLAVQDEDVVARLIRIDLKTNIMHITATTSGIDDIELQGGQLNVAARDVKVYDLGGQLMATGGNARLSPGTYVVKAGGRTFKVLMK